MVKDPNKPKSPKTKKSSKDTSKYVKTNSEFLSTKASDRKRIPAPGVKEQMKWKTWWLCDESKIGNATETIILKIENEQNIRYTSFINWARLYGNWEAMTWGTNILNNTNQDVNNESPLRLNLIQSGIDSCAAKIAKDNPQPYFITNGAKNYFDKLKAEKMTKYIRGAMQKAKVFEKALSQFRDECIYGTGALHFYIEDEEVKCDWVPTFELRVADMDGMHKTPRSMHRVRMMSREKLCAMFHDQPDKLEIIENITTNPTNRLRDSNNIVDMVRVKQSWHLPSQEGADDGVYAFTINDKCLCKEPWDLPFFPIVISRWYDRPLGFYGRSITEEVYSVQMSLDDLLNVAATSYAMVGVPIIFVPDGSQVPEDVILQNFIARMVPYRGNTPPQFSTPEPLPSSFFQWVGQHIQWVYQIIGISQTSATSQNQLGPDASGVAIRELVDIETSRFSNVSKDWEQNFINIGKVMIALTKKLAKQKPDIKVFYTDKKNATQYAFKDVELESFDIGCDVVSQAPDKVAGRIQTINDFVTRNWISPLMSMEGFVLDPDLEEIVKLKISSLTLTEQRLSCMVEDGEAYLPENYMQNLPECLDISLGVYNMLVVDECPEDRLQLVRNWIDALKMMAQPQPQQQQSQNGPQQPSSSPEEMAANQPAAQPSSAAAPQ